MKRRAWLALPGAALALTGCDWHREAQAAVFATYVEVLLRLRPSLAGLPTWDEPSFFELDRRAAAAARPSLLVHAVSKAELRSSLPDVSSVFKVLTRLQRSAGESLWQRNAQPRRLVLQRARLPSRLHVEMLSEAALRRLFSPQGDPDAAWAALRQRYPDHLGLSGFSSAGFSADGQQAVFVYQRSHGPMSGTGHLVLMQGARGSWALQEHRQLWVS